MKETNVGGGILTIAGTFAVRGYVSNFRALSKTCEGKRQQSIVWFSALSEANCGIVSSVDFLLQWLAFFSGQLSTSEAFALEVSQQNKNTTPLSQTASKPATALFEFCFKKILFTNEKNTRKLNCCPEFQTLKRKFTISPSCIM